MRLTRYSDYALRTLVYLASTPGRAVPVSEIAGYYGISQNHLAKVVQELLRAGLLTSTRGRAGGFSLALCAENIRLGETIRRTERDMKLVDCQGCVILPVCGIPGVLQEAMNAFVDALDRYTLADLAKRSTPLPAGVVRRGPGGLGLGTDQSIEDASNPLRTG